MIFKITKTACLPLVCIVALLMISLNAPTECYGESIPIEIDVAPNTLNIFKAKAKLLRYTRILDTVRWLGRQYP